MKKNKLRQPYFIYLLVVGVVGFSVVGEGFTQFPTTMIRSNLLLIIILAIIANIFASSTIISDKSVVIEVGTAVTLSIIPIFGPSAAAISAALCSLGIWLVFPSQDSNNKKKRNWEQLIFNASMFSVAMYVAGLVFINIQRVIGTNTILGQIIPWLAAAIVYDQLNFWLLMGIIRLKQGTTVKPFAIWRENLWAVPINIIILSVGGGVLAFAANQLGLVGIIVFFLPIILSAYAFRLYVNHMQEHMNNLENIVAERTQALQKAMEEKDAFLAVLTHDMKSPLTSIHLNAAMLKEYPHVLERKPHLLDAIIHSQETLNGIVNNILDLEKLKAQGELTVEKEVFEFSAVATNVFHIVRAQAEAKQIQLRLVGTDRQIMVLADRRHMERILHNLLTNAIKYTPAQGSVTAILSTTDSALCVQVQDSGFGIPADDLPFVFDRFHRVDSHKKLAAGTGLGLAITKALVEAHNGRIVVNSEEGQGSLFSAYLPILQQPLAELTENKNGSRVNGRFPTKPLLNTGPTFISY
ncbi:MAG: HAMP domain-containing sensor histidine kinase [Chloroflexota bacterium]